MPRVYLVTIALSILIGFILRDIWLNHQVTYLQLILIGASALAIYINEKKAVYEDMIRRSTRRSLRTFFIALLCLIVLILILSFLFGIEYQILR